MAWPIPPGPPTADERGSCSSCVTEELEPCPLLPPSFSSERWLSPTSPTPGGALCSARKQACFHSSWGLTFTAKKNPTCVYLDKPCEIIWPRILAK